MMAIEYILHLIQGIRTFRFFSRYINLLFLETCKHIYSKPASFCHFITVCLSSVILLTGGCHITIIYDALDLTGTYPPLLVTSGSHHWRHRYLSPPSAQKQVRWGTPLLVTSGGHHWRPIQTCSFGDPPERHLAGNTET